MERQEPEKEKVETAAEPTPGPLGLGYEAEDVFAGAEPWDPIETKLVVGSLVAALLLLVVLGILVNIYILK